MKKIEDLKKKALYAALALVPAIASGIASNLQANSESKSLTEEAEKKATAEATAALVGNKPAIAELQRIQAMGGEWAIDTEDDIQELMQEMAYLKADMLYCKAYVQFDSRGRYEYNEPEIEHYPEPTSYEPPPPSKPEAKMPENVQQAQQYMKARKDMGCDPGDPLCGAADL